jgi:hypothetical protein
MKLQAEDFNRDAYELLCECLESSDSITAYELKIVREALFEAYQKGIHEAVHSEG